MAFVSHTPGGLQTANWLLVADTQQQVAASWRLLRAGQRQREDSTCA